MRLGILGGTFDPVHFGHLLLAECCREQCSLDAVWFLPAAVPPHKRKHVLTPASKRVEMLRLAIGGHEQFDVCELEIERGGVSYSVDTLQTIGQQHPDAELFFAMGADSLIDLPKWREPARICQLATLMVVRRPQSPEPDFSVLGGLVDPQRLEQFHRDQVEMPLIGLSSTELRTRVAAGQSIRYRTPRAVEKYIQTQGLYRENACD
jgi:nicotinate-nucleotide adenylyltransferase